MIKFCNAKNLKRLFVSSENNDIENINKKAINNDVTNGKNTGLLNGSSDFSDFQEL